MKEEGYFKKKGTVIIVYLLHYILYISSDSRLNLVRRHRINDDEHQKEEDATKEEETLKTENYICYTSAHSGLRLRVEEVGEKIVSSDDFITGLAGDYETAHNLCLRLKKNDGEIPQTHDSLVEVLEKHAKSEAEDTDTDFVVATPNDSIVSGSGDFRVTVIIESQGGTREISNGDLVCFGSGGDLAYDYIDMELLDSHMELEQMTKPQLVDLFKHTVYKVCKKEKTVGGPVVITTTQLCQGNKLQTEFLKFPSQKKLWNINIKQNGIYISRKSFMRVVEDEDVMDLPYIRSKIDGSWVFNKGLITQDLVSLRIFLNVIDPVFYETSEYLLGRGGVSKKYELVFDYKEDTFLIGPGTDHSKEFEEFLEESGGFTVGKLFWDNDKDEFVIWSEN